MKFQMLTLVLLVMCCVFSTTSIANEPLVIAHGTGTQIPKQPQAVVGPDGTIHVVYGVAGEEVFHCYSADMGKSFSVPKLAFRTANMSLGMRRGPRIAVSKQGIVISAISGVQGKGKDGDVGIWRSIDSGKSWQGPVRVNDVADSAREGLHAMVANDEGSLWCVWLDLRAKRTELYAARSDDGGATWSANQLIYKSPDGSICECCHPSLAVQGRSVYVLFRNSLEGNRDMYIASAADGKEFEPAQRLGTGHWKLNACPMDGGMLSVDSRGIVSTVWRREGVVFATSKDRTNELLLGRGEQPWVAATISGPVAVWTAAREGELFVSRLSSSEPRSIAALAHDPVIVTSATGVGPVFVCWESKRGQESTIEGKVID